jgi:hypothetical protein
MNQTPCEPENVRINPDEFEVVRIEFLAHTREPCFTFNDGKIGVNTACVRRLPEVEFVQLLVNAREKKLAVRPALEEDIFSFQWAGTKDGKRFPRQVTGRIVFMKVFDMMGWNPDYRYKIVGKLVRANDELLFLFNLNDRQTFERDIGEDGKRKSSRKPVLPAEWKDHFGIPFSEHKKALQINLFDGYTVFSVKDRRTPEKAEGEEANE